jgi:hypothetical protein
MATDKHQDWVDRVMAQDTWEPSAHFTNRVVVASMAVLPPTRIRTFSRESLLAAITGFRDSMRARLEMSMWVLLQYRDLMLHS